MSYRPRLTPPMALVVGLSFSALTLGCSSDDGDGGIEVTNQDGDAWLSDHDSLYEGWPTNDKLANEGKADTVYPTSFFELAELQSPVRSQERRGVCSIFSGVGLMEHLYTKEGTLPDPDFSEEFLQWSTKVELGRFKNTEGSNSSANLQTIHKYGIVTEADHPYVGRRWTTDDDPECDGDNQPTKCYTHGDPSEAALAATRWHLPAGRWISSRPNSIKAHMVTKKEAVVVGGIFFYQSWNHRTSTLTTNNDYWRQGYVTYPNAADDTASREKRAGHSFVLIGWDDELEVQKRDGEGNLLTDGEGNPDMEKGFWLFKNSWGTGSFGVENPHGDGFGWISMEYVEDHLTAYVSGLPEVNIPEVCGNEVDDDYDGDIDCADEDCVADAACVGSTNLYTNDTEQGVPDNDPNGIASEILVTDTGTISAVKVTVDITHTYQGDLTVKLERDGTVVTLHEQTGGGEDNLQKTYVVNDFNGQDVAGTWRLLVSDEANYDTGTLNSWSLEIKTGGTSNTTTDESTEQVVIPDNNPTGAFTNIEVTDGGEIQALKVRVTIDHDYQGDLTVKLLRVGQPGEVVLQQADAASGQFGTKSYTLDDYATEDAAGTWRLVAIDEAAQDEGTLMGWSLEITR